MRHKETTRPRRRMEVKKETLRRLTLRDLTADDLANVVGGGFKKSCMECTQDV